MFHKNSPLIIANILPQKSGKSKQNTIKNIIKNKMVHFLRKNNLTYFAIVGYNIS
jgi:hypothetical protein